MSGLSSLALIASLLVTLGYAAGFNDDFNDGLQDTTRWKQAVLRRSSSELDALVTVAEQNGRLTIIPLPMLPDTHYNGYVSVPTFDMTGAGASVEVVQIASGKAATIFSIGIDKDNWFSFRAKGTTLYLEKRVAKTTSTISLTYSAAQHHFWRFRHDQETDSIVFETSPDGVTWTARHTIAREMPITAVQVELSAGTSEIVDDAGVALFDNFQIEASVPAPVATPSPTPSPTPTPPTPTPEPTPAISPTPAPTATPTPTPEATPTISPTPMPTDTPTPTPEATPTISPTPTPTDTPTPTPDATPAVSPSPTPTPAPPPPTPSPTSTPGTDEARGYLTTPAELREIKNKADSGIEPYGSAVASLLGYVGSPDYWPYGFVDPNNRDVFQHAAALVYAKALAYHLTSDQGYAESAREKLLELSTTVTCGDSYSGGNGCILTLSRHIPGYIAAADLIEGYAGWTLSNKRAFQLWLGDEVYRFTDWASDDRSTNWGSAGSAATEYIADYFTGSGLMLTDRNGVVFSPHDAYWEARQRALDRVNSNSYMYNSVCADQRGLGIQPSGAIPEETGRGSTGCDGTYLLSNDASYSYMQTHLSGTILQAELLLRRGDSSLFDNLKSDGGGSILRAILYVIENPNDPTPPAHWWDWIDSRKSILEISYRYYRHPAMGRQLGVGQTTRYIAGDGNSAMPHFGTLTHGFAAGENPAPPRITPAP